MTQAEFNKLSKAIDKIVPDLDIDKLTFNRLNTSALKVWATYFDKQINSVFAHVNHANIKKAESIDSRFADIINYAKLGLALFKDER